MILTAQTRERRTGDTDSADQFGTEDNDRIEKLRSERSEQRI